MRTLLITVILVTLLGLVSPAIVEEMAPWPTEGWATSSPEAQGLQSSELASLFETLSQKQFNLDSLLVTRNGQIVAEAYTPPFEQEMKHRIYSDSKSVTGTLIGIMLQKGYLESLDTPMLSVFPDMTIQNIDANKEAMTVRHLLMLASGFECDDIATGNQTVKAMMASEDWLQYALDVPMASTPGTEFHYCNPDTYILSAIITKLTGLSAKEFAAEHLFAPLGITDYEWDSSPQGISIGFDGLQMTTRDMAKLGYLYLRGGEWDGEQIIPADYADAAMTPQIETGWPDASYGYQWWHTPSTGVSGAFGGGGQVIVVDRAKDIVAVMTGAFTDSLSPWLFTPPFEYGIAALSTSETALPETPETLASLKARIATIENSIPDAVKPMPEVASQVSNQSYMLFAPVSLALPGPMGLGGQQTFSATAPRFDFSDPEQASLTFTLDDGEQWTMPVGLDGLYRVSDSPIGPVGVRGEWQTEDTFCVFMRYVGDARLYRMDVTFIPSAVQITTSEYVQGLAYTVQGVAMEE